MKTFLPLFAIMLLIGHATLAQTTESFTPSQDISIYSEGTSNSGARGDILTGVTCAGNTRRGLVQFDISTIPANATVTSATLTFRLSKVSKNPAIDSRNLHRVTTEWGEGTSTASGKGSAATANDATWNDAKFGETSWSTPGGDFDATVSGNQTFPASLENVVFSSTSALVADVQSWVNGTNPNYGWILVSVSGIGCSAFHTGSKEVGTAPVLEVTYSTPTNVDANLLTQQIKVYPNPAQEVAFVDLGKSYEGVEVRLLNQLGQVMHTQTFNATQKVRLSLDIAPGMYAVEVKTASGERAVMPIVKQ